MIFKVHQAIHGYADGHRQLACSIGLPTKDARLMLVMSDVSGPGVASLSTPYITGYPLAESGLYALSKTWPASEMSRPGCVWTHTLLIGFADLATLQSPSAIDSLFQRPQLAAGLDAYVDDFMVEPNEIFGERRLPSEAIFLFERLASALYENPDAQVWARRTDGPFIDEAVLRLWDQQWPRLKRSFRFCTLTSRDRSQEGMPFDLQLVPGNEFSAHLRFSSALEGLEAISQTNAVWLDDLVQDARFPHDSTLRPFLRKLGADMLGGREAMKAFCSLHAAFEEPSETGLSIAVRSVETSPELSASALVRAMVVQAALTDLLSIDDQTLEFVVNNFSLLPEAAARKHQDSLAQQLWERDPRRLISLSTDHRNTIRETICVGAASIPATAVIDQLAQVCDLGEQLLELLPSTAELPQFWASSELLPAAAALVGVDLSSHAVLRAMMIGLKTPASILAAVKAVGSLAVLDCLQQLIKSAASDEQVHLWVRFACEDSGAVAQFLTMVPVPSQKLLLLLAEAIKPDAVPNDIGADPWYLALSALSASEDRLPFELQVYGFRRALCGRSRSFEELIQLTFEPVHEYAESDTFPENQWRLLESSLPWAPFGQEWDKAIRLRRAVARRCTDLQLGAEGLLHLVKSDELFLQLLTEIWELWVGSKYLRSVSNALDEDSTRGQVVKSFIRQHSKFW